VEFNSWGVPIVEVSVNGSVKRFWLDTGASEMVISSDVAEEIGIVPKSKG
jgi:predicted aspartyl protease